MIVNGMNSPFLISEKSLSKQERGEYDFFRIFNIFFEELHNIALSRFTWNNLPDEIDPYAFEDILFISGAGLFIQDEECKKYGVTTFSLAGEMNIYGFPEMRYSYATPNYFDVKNPGNSVIVRDTPTCFPLYFNVYQSALMLTKIYMTKLVNLDQMKTPTIIVMGEEDKFSMQAFTSDLKTYKPIMKVKSDFNLDGIKCLNLNPPVIFDKLEDQIKQEKANVLARMGINVSSIIKKERVQSSEIDANNGEVMMGRYVGLSTRIRACKAINKMFGLDISVDFSTELYNDVIAFLGKPITEYEEGALLE